MIAKKNGTPSLLFYFFGLYSITTNTNEVFIVRINARCLRYTFTLTDSK